MCFGYLMLHILSWRSRCLFFMKRSLDLSICLIIKSYFSHLGDHYLEAYLLLEPIFIKLCFCLEMCYAPLFSLPFVVCIHRKQLIFPTPYFHPCSLTSMWCTSLVKQLNHPLQKCHKIQANWWKLQQPSWTHMKWWKKIKG